MRVLLVCTANQCRSPMAAALLRSHVAERGSQVTVESAGFGAPGYPAIEGAVAALARIGIDLSDHLSQAVTPELCRRADLVLTMTAQQLVDVVIVEPAAWPRCFTLVDFVRRAEALGDPLSIGGLETLVWRAQAGRTRAAVLGAGRADDVADPTGRSGRAFERTAKQLDGLVATLAHYLAPSTPATRA